MRKQGGIKGTQGDTLGSASVLEHILLVLSEDFRRMPHLLRADGLGQGVGRIPDRCVPLWLGRA
jgi:hypothetical protein